MIVAKSISTKESYAIRHEVFRKEEPAGSWHFFNDDLIEFLSIYRFKK